MFTIGDSRKIEPMTRADEGGAQEARFLKTQFVWRFPMILDFLLGVGHVHAHCLHEVLEVAPLGNSVFPELASSILRGG